MAREPTQYRPELPQDADEAASAPRPAGSISCGKLPKWRSQARGLWGRVRRRWWIVFIMTAGTMSAAGIYDRTVPPMYQATARIHIRQQLPESATNDLDRTGGDSPADLSAEADRLMSPATLSAALQTGELAHLPGFASPDEGAKTLQRGLRVSDEDGAIAVMFSADLPEQAAAVVNAVVEAYRHETSSSSQPPARDESIDPLEDQLATAQKRVAECRAALAALGPGDESDVESAIEQITADRRLEAMTHALVEAELASLRARLAYEAERDRAMSDPNVADQVQRLRQQGWMPDESADADRSDPALLQLMQQRDELARRYLPEHPRMRQVQQQIDQHLAQRLLQAEHRYQRAQAYEAHLAEALNEHKQTVVALHHRAAQHIALAEQLAEANRQVEALTRQLEQARRARVSAGAPALEVTVLEPASAESASVVHRRSRIWPEGLALGLVLGVGLSLVDRRYRAGVEIRRSLGLPIISVIPHTRGQQSASVRGKKVQVDPSSRVAEAYRTVRTALFFATPDMGAKRILIAGPSSGDGRSTLASNLAIALAQSGQKTLLLDADFRAPMQHRIHQTGDSGGLSAVLSGRRTLEQVIRRSGISNLQVLPAGSAPPNVPQVLRSARFEELLRELSGMYDHVVIDSPPALTAPDARILASLCDLTVLTLGGGRPLRRPAVRARNLLASAGARLLGVVVHAVPMRLLELMASGDEDMDHDDTSVPARPTATVNATSASTQSPGAKDDTLTRTTSDP